MIRGQEIAENAKNDTCHSPVVFAIFVSFV